MKKKNKRRLTALAISFLCLASYAARVTNAQEPASSGERASAASAAPRSVALTIQQAPSGAAQKVSCVDPQKCSLAVPIRVNSKSQTVTVNVSYVDGGALFTFLTPDGYLYAADKTPDDPKHPVFMATWGSEVTSGKPKTSRITLFDPPVPHPFLAMILDKTPGKAVADLDITVEAAP